MNQKELLMTPRNDFIFQKIFAKKENEEMLKELLEGILEIKINKIKAVKEMTMDKMLKKDKGSRIDIQQEKIGSMVIFYKPRG